MKIRLACIRTVTVAVLLVIFGSHHLEAMEKDLSPPVKVVYQYANSTHILPHIRHHLLEIARDGKGIARSIGQLSRGAVQMPQNERSSSAPPAQRAVPSAYKGEPEELFLVMGMDEEPTHAVARDDRLEAQHAPHASPSTCVETSPCLGAGLFEEDQKPLEASKAERANRKLEQRQAEQQKKKRAKGRKEEVATQHNVPPSQTIPI